jgi:inosose dehydratase
MAWTAVRTCVVLGILCLTTAPGSAQRSPAETAEIPRVVAQMYVWVQHNQEHGQHLEDHLDDAFAATSRAGFTAVQGWLSWFASDQQATATANTLRTQRLQLPEAYVDGPLHDERAAATIARIVEWAGRARAYGVATVVMNPDVRADGAEKTNDELTIQARNLNKLGAALHALGVSLAVHAHDKEMRSNAREWRSNLRQSDPALVGVCLDIHWVYRGGQDPIALIDAAGNRIRDVHLRNSRNGVWLEDLREGDVDYAAVARALRRSNYRGTYTVELAYEPHTVRGESIETDLRLSRAFVRRVFGL